MARPNRARYSVDLPKELEAKVTKLAESRGEQKSDVVRRALYFFLKHQELQKEGYEFRGIKKEGDQELIVIIVTT